METIRHALLLVYQDCFMSTTDLKDAYQGIPVFWKHHKYFRFRLGRTHYQFVRLCFGYTLAPWLFTKMLKVVYFLYFIFTMFNIFYLADCGLPAKEGLKRPFILGRLFKCRSIKGQSALSITTVDRHFRTPRVRNQYQSSIWTRGDFSRGHYQFCQDDSEVASGQDSENNSASSVNSGLVILILIFIPFLFDFDSIDQNGCSFHMIQRLMGFISFALITVPNARFYSRHIQALMIPFQIQKRPGWFQIDLTPEARKDVLFWSKLTVILFAVLLIYFIILFFGFRKPQLPCQFYLHSLGFICIPTAPYSVGVLTWKKKQ